MNGTDEWTDGPNVRVDDVPCTPVSVRPLRSRYTPETGDVVLGRVTEIAGKRRGGGTTSSQYPSPHPHRFKP